MQRLDRLTPRELEALVLVTDMAVSHTAMAATRHSPVLNPSLTHEGVVTESQAWAAQYLNADMATAEIGKCVPPTAAVQRIIMPYLQDTVRQRVAASILAAGWCTMPVLQGHAFSRAQRAQLLRDIVDDVALAVGHTYEVAELALFLGDREYIRGKPVSWLRVHTVRLVVTAHYQMRLQFGRVDWGAYQDWLQPALRRGIRNLIRAADLLIPYNAELEAGGSGRYMSNMCQFM
jgi:hypothetical protein